MNELCRQIYTYADVCILIGTLLFGIALGFGANLEHIGRVARWKAAEERRARENLVDHNCPREGRMQIEAGRPCDWCGQEEPKRG